MRCSCGSTKFVPFGIQETVNYENPETPSKPVHLINCVECGTTLSCSKHLYTMIKYLHQYPENDNQTKDLEK